MKPAVLNLELFKGDDYDLTLSFVDQADVPIDLTGRTFVAPVRRFADSRDATLFSIDATDLVGGVLRLSLASAATDPLVSGEWLLQETAGGKRHTILGGRLMVVQEARGVAEGVTATVRLAPDVVRVVTTGTTGPAGLSGAGSGPAGGVLAGSYPNPSFAVDMATQAELDAVDAASSKKAANLSDLANVATARTNLGLGSAATHPATDFDAAGAAAAAQAASQPVDSDLTAIAALSTTTFGRGLLALADAAAGRAALALGSAATASTTDFDAAGAAAAAAAALVASAPSTLDTLNELATALGDDPNFATTITTALAAKQPLDSDLTAIAALTTTAFGRSFLALADAVAGRMLLGLDSAATHPATDFDAAGAAAAAQAFSVQRANHTGTQAVSTVTGLQTALDSKMQALARTAVKTASYTAVAGDLVPVDTTSGAVTVTLPNAPADKSMVCVKHIIQGGTNAVTVACAGSDVFNRTGGATTLTLSLLAQGVLLEYTASAAVWTIAADDIPLAQLDARFQPLDSDLTAIAALSTTAFGRSVLDRADAAALRTLAGLGSLATLSTITSAEITDGTITDADVNAANKDGAVGTASLRTLGDGTAQASQGSKRAKSISDVHADAGPVNTTAETTMFSLAVPSTLVAGDVLQLIASGDMLNNSGSAVTYQGKIKLGSTQMVLSTALSVAAGAQRRQWWLHATLLVVSPSGTPDQRLDVNFIIGQTLNSTWPMVTTASTNAYLGPGRGVAAEDLTLAANLAFTMTMGTANALADFIIHEASLLVAKR